jgi:hypothetical protein
MKSDGKEQSIIQPYPWKVVRRYSVVGGNRDAVEWKQGRKKFFIVDPIMLYEEWNCE